MQCFKNASGSPATRSVKKPQSHCDNQPLDQMHRSRGPCSYRTRTNDPFATLPHRTVLPSLMDHWARLIPRSRPHRTLRAKTEQPRPLLTSEATGSAQLLPYLQLALLKWIRYEVALSHHTAAQGSAVMAVGESGQSTEAILSQISAAVTTTTRSESLSRNACVLFLVTQSGHG